MNRNYELRIEKMPALNWRFGASGGVAPRKMKWKIERLCPA
jgi:hypothetical protein